MEIGSTHKQALALMEAEDFAAAAQLLAELEREAPSWIVQNDLALCRSMTGELDAALAALDAILAADPANSFALINRYYLAEAGKVRAAPVPDPRAKIQRVIGAGPASARISVIMPTFNRPEEIRESIDSVIGQTFPHWELIVVNDGGDPAVERTIVSYQAEPRLRYVAAAHGGLSSARNVGMALAKGEYLTQLDDDDVYYPDHLETVARAFDRRPDCKVVYTDFNRAYQEERGGKWETVRREVDYSNDFSRALLKSGTIAPVCNLTHHREALETVGFYNEFILRAMDWEYFIRLARRYDFLHLKQVTGEFRQKSDRSQMTRSFQIPRNFHRNLVSHLHGFFPLTGARFICPGQGDGLRLQRGLDLLVAPDPDHFFKQRLELRKLLTEPYYALFYTLGKRLTDEGRPAEARRAFRAAIAVRPYELKAWIKWLGKEDI